MPTVIASDVQTIRKNSYAPSSRLDLTLVCNGEEPNQILDSRGLLSLAGIEAPTTAVTTVTGTGTTNFFSYVYVYAITNRYRFIQNLVAAGGDISPRSNPSPVKSVNLNYSSSRTLTIPTSSDLRVDKIWIYRTTSSSSADDTTFSEAGLFFYVGEVDNDPTVSSVAYIDTTTDANDVGEQVEYDNLIAPASALCVYSDPYFYTIGSFPLEFAVRLDADDSVATINTDTDFWLAGRDKQFAKLQGVDTGGFDGAGTFYFQWLSPTNATLTTDYEGTNPAGIGLSGLTGIKIYSSATTLYRSKPNNPLAWGETIAISDLALPRLWTFKLDGGVATALATLPNASLLKIDLIGPTRSYVLNTKLQGQEGFRDSKRTVSEIFSASSQTLQFPYVDARGESLLAGLDLHNKALFQCNGNAHQPIGGNLIDLIRQIDLENLANYHGIYDPQTECFFIWIKEQGEIAEVTKAIVYHGPSGQWSIISDFDITASALFTDTISGQTMILGGTAAGQFGELICPDKYINWLSDPVVGDTPMVYPLNEVKLAVKKIVVNYLLQTVSTLKDHLTYFIIYLPDADGVEASFFIYFDVGTTGDSPPAISSTFDYILVVNIADGSTSIQCMSAFRAAWNAAVPENSFATASVNNEDGDSILLTADNNVFFQNSIEPELGTFHGTLVLNDPGSVRVTLNTTDFGLNHVTDDQLVGTWALIETANKGRNYFWGRIRYYQSSDGAYWIDQIYPQNSYTGTTVTGDDTLNIYFGLIECAGFKSFDLAEANASKSLKEIWMAGSEAIRTDTGDDGASYHDRKLLFLLHPQLDAAPTASEIPNTDKKANGSTEIEMYFGTIKNFSTDKFKSFGISWKQRGYSAHEARNLTLHFNG